MLPQFFLFLTIAGGTSPGPDIFTRQRIHDCGASMMRRAGAEMDWGAKFDEWPAIAREIDVDAATASRDAGNGSVYYAVALMVDQQSRVEHTRELLARHPRWHVFNSTSKYSVDVLYRHYVGMGLRLREFKLEPLLGKVAWRGTARETRKRHRNNRSSPVDRGSTVAPPVVFPEHPPFRRRWWTCIRFCMLVLGSGHAYGVMLNDDVTVAHDFERTLEAHLLRFSEPMKFATYRLGQFDLGLVVSRESAARQLGIICDLETIDHFHDHFTSRTHRWLPHVVGNCPITYAGRPLEGLARPHGALHAKSNILGVANEASDAEFLARVHNRPRDRPGFCGSAYPGRIFNRSHLGAWIHADPALRPANAPLLSGPQGTVARPVAPDLRAATTHALLTELADRVKGPGGGAG